MDTNEAKDMLRDYGLSVLKLTGNWFRIVDDKGRTVRYIRGEVHLQLWADGFCSALNRSQPCDFHAEW